MAMDKYCNMALTLGEIKLITRLRQLRKQDQTSMFWVSTNPLSISVMGKIELMEQPCISGSGGCY